MPNTPSIFLINSDTFKKSFLSGSGQLELQSDQNIWATLIANDGKFAPTIDRIADVNFSFSNNQQFKLGNQAGMKLGVSACDHSLTASAWIDCMSSMVSLPPPSAMALMRLVMRPTRVPGS